MTEILNATLTKEEVDLLRQRRKVKRIIRNGHFVRGSFLERTKGGKRRKLATSSVLHYFTVTGACPP